MTNIYGARAAGHTYLMMHGVIEGTQHKKVVVLVENQFQGDYILEQYKLSRNKLQLVTYSNFERLRSVRGPIAIDNLVMSRLLRDVLKLIHHLLIKITRLEAQLEEKENEEA